LNLVGNSGSSGEHLLQTLTDRAPVCHWAFDRAHRFHLAAGDVMAVFHKDAPELWDTHVSVVDDPRRIWSRLVKKTFDGESPIYRVEGTNGHPGYSVIQLPIRARDESVLFAAGYAYKEERPVPKVQDLESMAPVALQALASDRARTSRFLHDVVAQGLSATGCQIEIVDMAIREKNLSSLETRTADLQAFLEHTLKLVRQFIAATSG
jgi:signal transduction histidine kinase